MTSSARIDDLQRKYQENPRRYFAPLANELRRAGEAGRAVSICETGLSADPGHLSGHVVLGQALADLGDRGGAERAFGRAVELDPENVVALRSLGDLARDRGDVTVARGWYQRALETDPRDPELATRMSTLDAPSSTPEGAARRESDVGPAIREDDVIPAAGLAGGTDALAARLPDEAHMREFQAEREAQEFTAGFFAALLDAQAEETEAPRDAGARHTPEPTPVEDDRPLPTDAGGEHRDALPESPAAPPTEAVEEPPATPPTVDAPDDELAESAEAVRPPEVTVAEDALDVRPDEREYLDDLMELDGELASDVYADETAVVDEVPSLAGFDAVTGAGEIEGEGEYDPEGVLDRPLEVAVGTDDLADVPADVEPANDEAPVAAAAAGFSVASEPSEESPAPGSPIAEPIDDDRPADEEAPQLSFVTATMGTLLLQQGFRSDALQIFRQLSAQNPDDADLRARVEELEAELAPGDAAGGGMTVSGWLRALAAARPDAAGTPSAPAASDPARTADTVPAVEREASGGADWVEAIPEPEPAADLTAAVDGDQVAARPAEEPADQPVEEPLGEPAASGGAAWVEAIPEDGIGAAADVVADSVAEADSVADPVAAASADSFADTAADADPVETDLLAGAAAAAASAVTWEATEPEAASDELFFGDDPLDWGQVRAPESVAETAPETVPESAAQAAVEQPADPSLEELLGRPVSADDELAAGALASATLAMQGDAEVDAALAEASAEDPMALDNVLTPTPTSLAALRGGASFSFEQFFRPEDAAVGQGEGIGAGSDAAHPAYPESTAAPGAGSGTEAARSADDDAAAAREADLADFHAWLAGLSKS